jgi:Sec-independent protein secretion pathway component TatC
MRAFGIEPDEVIQQFVVKGIYIREEEVFVVCNKLLLDGSVRAFCMGIHFSFFVF